MSYSTMIYNQKNLTELDWPASEEGDYARRYLVPFIENGPQTYIRNIHTTLSVLRVGDTILPITFGAYHPDNSYVCSPYNHYITYGQEELRHLKNPPVERLLHLLFVPIAWYFRRHEFDRVVLVNNWLLSTNLYPQINDEQIRAALTFLVDAFPDRAIVFRSVDGYRNQRILDTLTAQGCRMIFSRQVYYQHVESAYVQKKRQYKSDLKIYQRTEYRVVDGSQLRDDESIERIVALYNDLYLHKYSFYNPQFSPAFIRLALDNQLLRITAFQQPQSNRIDAVMGNFSRQGVITAPLFGYDTQLPQELALYRLLSTLGSLQGQEQKKLVNMSAGVGDFKRLRGGIPVMEYNAVYDAHLPATRRRPWSLLKGIMDRVAVPIIKKYGF